MAAITKTQKTYAKLAARMLEIRCISSASGLLARDQDFCMPSKGAAFRASQLGLLSEIEHQMFCSPKTCALLDALSEQEQALTPDQAINVRLLRRDLARECKIPNKLVRDLGEATSRANSAYAKAKAQGDFKIFAPHLKILVDLSKEKAAALGYPDGGCSYDALLDGFEPEATVAMIDPIVAEARDISINALCAIQKSRKTPKTELLTRPYPIERQKLLDETIARTLGFDFEAGRFDQTPLHPYVMGFCPGDVRVLLKFEEKHLANGTFGTIHETGHSLYEQGITQDHHLGMPLSTSISLGIHESQSRLFENQIGRSRAFWEYFFPRFKKEFRKKHGPLSGVSLNDFYFAINSVKRSLVRTAADEVSYNLHIAIRWELEQLMFNGNVDVMDLPRLWDEKTENYLGIKPSNDKDGILQDVHWSMGYFGYFVTYLLGNLYAAQFMAAMRKDLPDLDEMILKGRFLEPKLWLNYHIHQHGRRYSATELVKLVTGEPLNPKYFDAYLKAKYGPLYGVSW